MQLNNSSSSATRNEKGTGDAARGFKLMLKSPVSNVIKPARRNPPPFNRSLNQIGALNGCLQEKSGQSGSEWNIFE
jgi:hypothetical protein